MENNKVKLRICGGTYSLSTDDPASYWVEVWTKVDQYMQELLASDERISMTTAAVLSALYYCDTAERAVRTADNLRTQMKGYYEDNARLRQTAETAVREKEQLRQEIYALKQKAGLKE